MEFVTPMLQVEHVVKLRTRIIKVSEEFARYVPMDGVVTFGLYFLMYTPFRVSLTNVPNVSPKGDTTVGAAGSDFSSFHTGKSHPGKRSEIREGPQ